MRERNRRERERGRKKGALLTYYLLLVSWLEPTIKIFCSNFDDGNENGDKLVRN